MHITFLTSTRRNFLRHCGLLATATAAPTILGGRSTPCLYSSAEPDWLREWNELPRRPVQESSDTVVAACLEAADRAAPVSLYYHGGSSPGRLRKFSPDRVFLVPGHDHGYVSGYCHLRRAPRILRADRIALG